MDKAALPQPGQLLWGDLDAEHRHAVHHHDLALAFQEVGYTSTTSIRR